MKVTSSIIYSPVIVAYTSTGSQEAPRRRSLSDNKEKEELSNAKEDEDFAGRHDKNRRVC